ncbi:hypothetical protein COOONC_20976 [Cooperia oncophora]
MWAVKSDTMDHVPLEYRTLRDGFSFLQLSYSGKACEAGLHAIIAGGMHSLQAKSLGYNAQLYCVHGVCSLSIEVPLLYCITSKKTQKVYTKIFDHVKASITGDVPRRVILDFEKAAISAARDNFPEASIEGIHIVQAWNRKRNDLGLKKFTQELKKYFVLIPRVKALQAPPVPTGHAAYETCEGLLSYFDADWLQGTFKDMWCKWKLEDLRTTNIAEAFHRWLGFLIDVDHPPLSLQSTPSGNSITKRRQLLSD